MFSMVIGCSTATISRGSIRNAGAGGLSPFRLVERILDHNNNKGPLVVEGVGDCYVKILTVVGTTELKISAFVSFQSFNDQSLVLIEVEVVLYCGRESKRMSIGAQILRHELYPKASTLSVIDLPARPR